MFINALVLTISIFVGVFTAMMASCVAMLYVFGSKLYAKKMTTMAQNMVKTFETEESE